MRRRVAGRRPDRLPRPSWWSDAVFYEIYVRSFADSGEDGIGDLEGIRSKLGYLELLGVDALYPVSVSTSRPSERRYPARMSRCPASA
ncbi:hypothetical protein ABT261_22485, partial [Amycolatopsis sp. NPDC000740]